MKTFSFVSAALLLASAPIATATPNPGLEDQSPMLEVRWVTSRSECSPSGTAICASAAKRDIEALSIGGPASSNGRRNDGAPALRPRVLQIGGRKCVHRPGIKCLARKDVEAAPQALEVRVVGWGRTCVPRKGVACLARRDLEGLVASGRASLETRGVAEQQDAIDKRAVKQSPTVTEVLENLASNRRKCVPRKGMSCMH